MVWVQKDDLTKESKKVWGEWWHQQEEQRQTHEACWCKQKQLKQNSKKIEVNIHAVSGFDNRHDELWIELETGGSNECEREWSN